AIRSPCLHPYDAAAGPSARRRTFMRRTSRSEVHPSHVTAGRAGLLRLLGVLGDDHLGGEQQAGDRRGVLQRGARDLRRVDDARGEHVVDERVRGGVVAVLAVVLLTDRVDDHAALGAGVGRDLAGGLLEGAHEDRRAGLLVAFERVGDLLDGLDRVDQRHAAARDDALLDGRAGGRQGVLEAVLLLLELGLGGSADADDRDAAGQLGQALLELLTGVVRVGGLELGLDALDALLDAGLVALAFDDRGLVLAGADALGAAELAEADVLELVAELLADDLAAGDGRDVLEHLLAAVAEAGGLDGEDVEGAAQLVEDERGEGLAFDVLSDDHQRLAGLDDLLEDGQEVLQRADLLLVDQDVRVLEHRLHGLGVGDEVGADVALVELHALDDVELGVEGLRLLDGDDAVAADLVHGVGDQLADLGVVGGDRGDLGDGLAVLDRAGELLDAGDGGLDGL